MSSTNLFHAKKIKLAAITVSQDGRFRVLQPHFFDLDFSKLGSLRHSSGSSRATASYNEVALYVSGFFTRRERSPTARGFCAACRSQIVQNRSARPSEFACGSVGVRFVLIELVSACTLLLARLSPAACLVHFMCRVCLSICAHHRSVFWRLCPQLHRLRARFSHGGLGYISS